MFDFHSEIYTFTKKHVSLDGDTKKELRTYRDTNIPRLKSGLKKLGFNNPVRTPNQGSYPMGTMNKRHENNPDLDYDIDIATIFKKEDLPDDPLKARIRVLAGVLEGGGNFRQDPKARTNAVTIWYQEGYHVDLAVYRTYTDWLGREVIEHAGVNWTPRDPMDITNWFNNAVNTRSPSPIYSPKVEDGQLHRIVQMLKFFAKSRPNWQLPGGLLISVLAEECYSPNSSRDDVALYNTLDAITVRLSNNNFRVFNPVDRIQELTYKSEYINQVGRFKEKLDSAQTWLAPIFETNCDRLKAAKAWNKVFKHSYWQQMIDEIVEAENVGENYKANIGGLFVSQSGRISTQPQNGGTKIPDHRFYGE